MPIRIIIVCLSVATLSGGTVFASEFPRFYCEIDHWQVNSMFKNQTSADGINQTYLLQRLETERLLVDPMKQHFSCIDGRSTLPILGTPGGDLGEFLLAVTIFHKHGGSLENISDFLELYQRFLAQFTSYALVFYHHTDEHVLEKIREELHDEEFEIDDVPEELQNKTLELLVNPDFVGCGHIKQLLLHPDEYETPLNITKNFLRAFFLYLWNYEQAKAEVLISDLEVLSGHHEEKAVLEIQVNTDSSHLHGNDTICNRVTPLVTPSIKGKEVMVYHADAVKHIRWNLATFFAAELNHTVEIELIYDEIRALGLKQLNLTLSYLVPDLPIYEANTVLKKRDPELSTRTILTILIVLSGACFSSGLLMFACFFHKPTQSNEPPDEKWSIQSKSSKTLFNTFNTTTDINNSDNNNQKKKKDPIEDVVMEFVEV